MEICGSVSIMQALSDYSIVRHTSKVYNVRVSSFYGSSSARILRHEMVEENIIGAVAGSAFGPLG